MKKIYLFIIFTLIILAIVIVKLFFWTPKDIIKVEYPYPSEKPSEPYIQPFEEYKDGKG